MAADRTLFRERSRFQEIHLFQEASGALGLTLDGFWQFHSSDERGFHQMLAEAPLSVASAIGRVLVLGGGDALALRHVVGYDAVQEITLCELDDRMLAMTRDVAEMGVLTEHALLDPRVEAVAQDAREFIASAQEKFDVVICDFPSPTNPDLLALFSAEFFQSLRRVCERRAVVMTQVSADPKVLWPILTAAGQSFAHTLPLLLDLGSDKHGENWANFVLMSDEPLRKHRDPVTAGPLTLRPLEDYAIQNRGGEVFESAAYGRFATDD